LEFKPIETGVPVIGGGLDMVAAKVQEGTNESYKRMREEIEGNLRSFARARDKQFREQIVEPGKAGALNTLREVRNEGARLLLAANRGAQSTAWTSITFYRALHTLELLLFFMVCAKSFSYVFARVAFQNVEGTFLTLGRMDGQPEEFGESQIKRTGDRYSIPRDVEDTYYISRRFQCRGRAPRFSIPQPFHAPIARLLHKGTAMNEVEMRPGDGPVTCSAAQGSQFLEWNLREGETVVFDFHNFVGISRSVRISTLISPRLSTLLLGKFIFSTATGPGKLILMTLGRAEITGRELSAESFPPERLVAMRADTRLFLESELSLVDVYLSSAYVRPADGGEVIVDVDSQRGSGVGLGRFFTRFLWPG
jgi:hypothetical protein